MTNLQINLLGPPEILWEDKRLNINRRIPRTLLYFLATQNNFIGRGKLVSIFWEDYSPQIARRRLREALSRLRAEVPVDNFILNENDLVGLNRTNMSVDYKEFKDIQDDLGGSLRMAKPDQLLPEETIQPLKLAVDLWRGNQFLEGTELPKSRFLDDWRYQTNLDLTHARIRLLTILSDHYYASGQFEESLRYAKLAVESDTFDEDLRYRVLRLLVEMERNQEASLYYSATAELLKDELDLMPSQQLVSIYRQIQRTTHQSTESQKSDWRLLSSIRTPFVGRQSEVKQLQEAMESGKATLVFGDSGLGKTRLVQEFSSLYSPTRRIIGTYCRPAEVNLPYQPFIELLRNNVSSSEWNNYPGIWAEPLSTILPEILPNSAAGQKPVMSLSVKRNRSTIFEAIRQVFLLLSQVNDLILFIDDLHWADVETIATIAYLSGRDPFNENSFMILAARSDEPNQSIEDILLANQAESNLTILELGRFNHDEISGLGRYVLGYPLDRMLVRQLDDETGGNPFILLETLRSVQGKETISGLSGKSSSVRLPLAESVYSLVKKRLANLSPTAREICEYAAVIGKEFDPILISISNNQPLSITGRAIEELKQRNIIEPVHRPNQEIIWRFIHDKIRESIILDTNRIRLRFLHANVAETLEEKYGPQNKSQSALLARHYEYAGRKTIAFNYWLQAAQWARQLFSSSEALRILSHAENIILESPELIGDELVHDLYIESTELAQETSNAELIREHNNRLLDLGQMRNNKYLMGTALVGLSTACFVDNNFEDGLAYTNQAISYLEGTDKAYEIINSHTNRGLFLYMLGRLNEAIESLEYVLELDFDDSDPSIRRGLANAHYHLGLSQTLAGWPELGLKNANKSYELAASIGHHHIMVTSYMASSLAFYFMAAYKKGRIANDAGIMIAKKLHASRMMGYLYACKAFLEYSEGYLGSAYELSEQIYKIGQEHHHQELQALALRIRGDIYMLLESYNEAFHEFKLGTEFGKRDFWGLDNLVRKGYSQVKIGQVEPGMVEIHRGIDLAQSAGFGIVEIRGMQFLGYAYAAHNDWELTNQITEQLIRTARIRSMPLVGILAKLLNITGGHHQNALDDGIDQLDYLMKMVGNEQPYIQLRILIQKIRLMKIANLDVKQEINQVNEILEFCEKLAYPGNIQVAFQKFKNKVDLSISN